ncbi:MAG: NADH-dependent [FeFe] hydrogenase, group A6 [Candidatus Omnitrophica bacterium]|nr:NADH-dependent [FeFe] hydrogenase, group A6 [Candidatus Omnitrophota bacterium]
MTKNVTLTIDSIKVSVPAGATIMEAADSVNVRVPRLCYHSRLSSFGACRICVVEVAGMKNYPPACSTQVKDGMVVMTSSPAILKARRQILELMLNNHNRDCTVCRKNNECELQSLAAQFGLKDIVFEGERKQYPVDRSSAAIVRDSEKCILCNKCVRVCSEIQGVHALTMAHRGFKANVVPAYEMPMADSVCINCGQCVNVCPTGALSEKDAIEDVWRAIQDPGKIVLAQVAPAVRIAIGEGFGSEPGTDLTSETVTALKMLGFDVVFDTQFSADLTIVEEGNEFVHRLKNKGVLPMITSCSPGWIKFCESFYPAMLPHISTCKSPQQMMGAMIKTYYAKKTGIDPASMYSVSIMPCTAKKYEAHRPEMNASGYRDVDAVLTTRELVRMIKEKGLTLHNLPKTAFDSPMGESSGAAPIFGATGGVMEAALRTAYEVITGTELTAIDFKQVRGLSHIKEAVIPIAGTDVRVCVINTLSNVHKVFRDVLSGKKTYHFIEVMTCPGGCLGGGGQPYPQGGREPLDQAVYAKRAAGLYRIDDGKPVRKSHNNPDIIKAYEDFLGKPLGKVPHMLLHTHYHQKLPHGVVPKRAGAANIFK